jgi:hypothetical protein
VVEREQSTRGGLCQLTEQLVESSSRFRSLRPWEQAVARQLGTRLCGSLDRAAGSLTPSEKTRWTRAYQDGVLALARHGWLTRQQADTLIDLSRRL